jgi:hypothetical protein
VELVIRVVHKHDDAADASLGGIVVEKGKFDTGQFIPKREEGGGERESLNTLLVVLEESPLLSITKEHLYFAVVEFCIL